MNPHRAGRATQETVDQRLARWAAAQHGVFSRSQAFQAGATAGLVDGRLATSRWESLFPGVYRLSGAPASRRQRLVAACLAAGDDAAASHRAAATLWHLPGSEEIVEISVPRRRRVRLSGIHVHQVADLADVDVTRLDAIPLTTPARTLLDLAGVVAADVLEEALDDALRRRLTSLARLRWRLTDIGRRGRPGIRAIRALVQARDGTDATPESVLETRLLRLLRRARLPTPVSQHPVRAGGRVVAFVDFAYPEVRLAIEVDGYRWHSGRARWQSDLARRNELTALGWHVVHVTSVDLQRDPDKIIQTISRALRWNG